MSEYDEEYLEEEEEPDPFAVSDNEDDADFTIESVTQKKRKKFGLGRKKSKNDSRTPKRATKVAPNAAHKAEKSSKKITASVEEKKLLASYIKEEELIWDLQNPLHCNGSALASAWTRVAEKMNRSGMYIILNLSFV